MEDKKSSYTGFTEARKKANEKYMSKYVEVKVRMTPDKRTIIQDHAIKLNESTTSFINRAIDNQMERDNGFIYINDNKSTHDTLAATTTKPAPDQSKQTIQPAEQIEPSIISSNNSKPLNNNGSDSDFAQRFGFTR